MSAPFHFGGGGDAAPSSDDRHDQFKATFDAEKRYAASAGARTGHSELTLSCRVI